VENQRKTKRKVESCPGNEVVFSIPIKVFIEFLFMDRSTGDLSCQIFPRHEIKIGSNGFCVRVYCTKFDVSTTGYCLQKFGSHSTKK
jgi:hypothetical protein